MTMTGIVKFFLPQRGYGWIAVAPELRAELGLQPNRDLYVHATGIEGYPRQLNSGDRVAFDIEKTESGPRAIRVRVLQGSPAERLQHIAD